MLLLWAKRRIQFGAAAALSPSFVSKLIRVPFSAVYSTPSSFQRLVFVPLEDFLFYSILLVAVFGSYGYIAFEHCASVIQPGPSLLSGGNSCTTPNTCMCRTS